MNRPPASSDTVRRRMQQQRVRDTEPELALRRELHRRGYRYRVDYALLPTMRRRRADIVFTRQKIAVFLDGCFWHGCDEHGTVPTANRDWWRNKIQANRERDRDTNARLQDAGWRVIRIWEHQGQEEVMGSIVTALEDQSRKT